MSILKPLIVILGPTSSGKTDMSLKLAKIYDGEIINADSRQIYQEMPIGTGSPINCNSEFNSESSINFYSTPPMPRCQHLSKTGTYANNIQKMTQQLLGDKTFLVNNIPHHLFNIKKPNQKFSLSQYKKLAVKTINTIHKRGKTPILVGGTGLYISAIVDNLEIPQVPPNNKIRMKLEKHTEKYLYKRLKKIDETSSKIISPNNKRKLIRALEVFELTGKPFSIQQKKGEPLFNVLQIGINTDRLELYKKIDLRVDEMIEQGLIKEAQNLIKKYKSDLPAMSGIGYSEIASYLINEMTLEEAIQRIKFRTHQYARRQLTWFKRDKRILWTENYREVIKLINKLL